MDAFEGVERARRVVEELREDNDTHKRRTASTSASAGRFARPAACCGVPTAAWGCDGCDGPA